MISVKGNAFSDTLQELIKEAIDINNKLFERSIEKRHDGGVAGFRRIGYF